MLGGSCNRTGFDREMRVRLAGGEYFTDDYTDVIGTARHMAKYHTATAARLPEAEADLAEQLRQDVLPALSWTEVQS
jgi:hypothetical protein